jgi:hypothetical protein
MFPDTPSRVNAFKTRSQACTSLTKESLMMRLLVGLVFGISMVLPASAMGSKSGGYTLLLVPAKYAPVQIGRDFVDRQRVLLMTYEVGVPANEPFLNAWSGSQWVRVPADAYASGTFALSSPGRTVVVGQPTEQVAKLIEMSAAWAPQVLNVESDGTAELVNAMGRFFNFSRREWEWYAARYQLKLEDLNYEVRHQSWYDTHTASMLPPPTKPFQPALPPVQVRETTPPRPLTAEDKLLRPAAPAAGAGEVESFSFDGQ